MSEEILFIHHELRRLFQLVKDMPIIENFLIEFEEELDEDIYPTMTIPIDGEIRVRGVDVEKIVIEREEARESIVKRVEVLKRDQAVLFDAMSRLTSREQDIVRSIYIGDSVPQIHQNYENELLNSIKEKLFAGILEIRSGIEEKRMTEYERERQEKASAIKRKNDRERKGKREFITNFKASVKTNKEKVV
ncbi:hypothetical protein [Alkalihalobacterium alkalinitrilicum]|uniref:hypothetical protein n=1 Tax=Alkalihalobacterium alkalinitrilicum TaxID=427920 RepID=UPI00099581A7|nr:hypothetical protein [Alkalihalobacterium alkalinitrilicum]